MSKRPEDNISGPPAAFTPPPSGLEWFEEPADLQVQGDNPAANDKVAALELQLAEMRGELSAQRMQSNFVAAQPAVPAPVVKEISYDDLPDPLVDPKGYAKEVATRTQAYYASQRAADQHAARQQQDESARYNQLWENFAKENEDYAGQQDLAEFATRKVVTQYAQQGVDVNRQMFGNTKQFFADVRGEMDRVTGKKLKTEADDDDDRTNGMFGGMESGGRAGDTGKRQARPESMFDSMTDWQVKNGFY